MTWLHTWSGLIVGWLLFAIFLTGTASVFHQEISLWMQPEVSAAIATPAAAPVALNRLQAIAPDASHWLIDLPDTRAPLAHLYIWRDPGQTPEFQVEALDPATGAPTTARATYGGDFLYYFHFDLQMPSVWGRVIVGAAAIVMLVTIVSGVVTHRRIFKDFFSFRPGRPVLRSWREAHNAVSVLALPFHLMITYTGLITLMFLYMPWGIDAAYEGDRQAFFSEMAFSTPIPEAANVPAPLAPIGPLMEQASRRWGGDAVGRISVYRPGDANALIELISSDAEQLAYHRQKITFDGVTGDILATTDPTQWAAETRGVLYGLHLGRFADPLLRWLYFLSGLAGSAMIATGLIFWAGKRRPRQTKPGFGQRLVEGLNVAAIVGLPIAIAVLFWANRLLPITMQARADWEARCFFAAWALCAIHALARPVRRAWTEQLSIAAALFGTLPLLNALVTHTHLGESVPHGDWVRAGFDLTMLTGGVLLGVAAWQVARQWPRAVVFKSPGVNTGAAAAAASRSPATEPRG